MKRKIIILFFLFSSFLSHSSFADDISDFQIEGISIGDSLLDYMSEKKIKTEIINILSALFNIYLTIANLPIFDLPPRVSIT